MKRLFSNPYLLLTLASLFWAGNMVMSRGLRNDVPPIALTFWRWTIALILLLPFALPHLRSQWPALRRGWRAVVFLGVLGVGCYNAFSYIAVQYTTATSATLLNSFVPIATIGFSFLIFGKRLKRIETIGVVVSLAGVLLLVSRGSLEVLFGLGLNTGDLWMLLAVLTWGLYTVGLQWRPSGVHPMLLLAAFAAVGLAVLVPAYAWELASGRLVTPSVAAFAGIFYAGAIAGFLGFVCFNTGVTAVGAARGSLFIHLMPVFASMLSAVFLGEQAYWYHFAGIALVFAGIALTTWRPSR